MNEGVSALDLFDGPFAVAFCDGERIWLARDRWGIYPLFYIHTPGYFAFASERKAFPNLKELHPRQRLEIPLHGKPIVHKISTEFETLKVNETKAMEVLDSALQNAVRKRVAGCREPVALLLSGGVDSALLAFYLEKMGIRYTAVSVGLKSSKSSDLERAGRIAEKLSIPLEACEVSKEEAMQKIREVSKIIESSDPVKVEAAAVVYLASEKAGKKVVLAGFGADELFGGYARMHRSPKLENWWALRNIHERSTYFANVAGLMAGAEVRIPYLDNEVVNLAMGFPSEFVAGKYIFRRLAETKIGGAAHEPKKAAQYGSGVSKVLPKPKGQYLKRFWPKNRKLAALVSGGKDSWYSVLVATRMNYEIGCIITMLPEKSDSWMFQTPDISLIRKQAEASGIPLIIHKTSGEKEKEIEDLDAAIHKAEVEYGVEGVLSGAISSEYQRSRIEDICEKHGLSCHAPLWGVDHASYLRSAARELGFVIVSVAADGLDGGWVGRRVTPAVAEELVMLSKKFRFSPAGEGGEFETFVENSPSFSKSIPYKSPEQK